MGNQQGAAQEQIGALHREVTGLKGACIRCILRSSFIIPGRKLISSLSSIRGLMRLGPLSSKNSKVARPRHRLSEGQSSSPCHARGSDPHRIGSDPTHEH